MGLIEKNLLTFKKGCFLWGPKVGPYGIVFDMVPELMTVKIDLIDSTNKV